MGRKTAVVLGAMIALAVLVLLAFSGVLSRPGMVGHTWDWGVPAFAEQFRDMAWRHLSTWDDYFETDRYHYFKLELLYWWILWPFSVAGGEAVSKWLPLVLTFCAGAAMWPFARRQGLPPLYAGVAAVFYAFSPYALSRIVAGHMPMLAGYALLPLVILAAQALMARVEDAKPGVVYYTVLTGFLLGLTSLHPGVGMSAAAMLTIAFAWRVLCGGKRRLTLCAVFVGLGLVAVAMNIHFMAPFVGDYFGRGAIRHGWGLSVSAEGDVTVDTELPRREAYHESTSQPVDASALLRLRPGMDTEYVYPIPHGLGVPWHLAAVAVALCVFAYAFRARKTPELSALFVTAVVGVLLVSGSRTLPGMLFYQLGLKKTLPILFAAFSNTTRWLPLVVLPYAILFARAAADLAAAGRPKLVGGAAALATLVFVSPFLAGGLTRPFDPERDIQPLTLKQTPIGPDDAAVYTFLRDRPDAFRVAYLPPIGITWPGETQSTFEWTSAYSPKPFFLAFKTHPLAEPVFRGLYAEHPATTLARLAALGSCRFLVYPHYAHAYTYDDFQPAYAAPDVVDGYKDYKPVFDANLALQRGLRKLPLFGSVDVYENEAFLPLVRPGDRIAAVEPVGGTRPANPVVAALAEEVALPDYDPGTVYLRAGRDPVFLEFLEKIMGDGPKKSRLLVGRASDERLVVERRQTPIAAPRVEFRRLGHGSLSADLPGDVPRRLEGAARAAQGRGTHGRGRRRAAARRLCAAARSGHGRGLGQGARRGHRLGCGLDARRRQSEGSQRLRLRAGRGGQGRNARHHHRGLCLAGHRRVRAKRQPARVPPDRSVFPRGIRAEGRRNPVAPLGSGRLGRDRGRAGQARGLARRPAPRGLRLRQRLVVRPGHPAPAARGRIGKNGLFHAPRRRRPRF